MKNVLCAIFLYFLLLCPLQCPARLHLDSRRLSSKDGLACNTINDVTQDSEGYIWIATPSGISRYDGYSFINFYDFLAEGKRTHASISQLISDNAEGLMWAYAPDRHIYCYDLHKAQFVDYTNGSGKGQQPFNRRMLSHDGIWLYSGDYGARHITYKQRRFGITDYTVANNGIISSKGLNIVEDAKLNVWIASQGGLNMITPDGKSHIKVKGSSIIVLTTGNDLTAALTSNGEARLYNGHGKLVKTARMPSMDGFKGKSRASMFWNGCWYIFTEKTTFAMNLKTGRFFKPVEQIENAIDKNQLKSYKCFYDKHGNVWLFGKKGFKRRFQLISNQAFINARGKNFVATEDRQGRVYIASYGSGLFVYDPHDDKLYHFSAKDPKPLIHTDFLLNTFIDRSGCVWVCTGEGLYCVRELRGLTSELVKMEYGNTNEWSNYVRHISPVGADRLAISTRTNNTYIYNIHNGESKLSLKTNACVYCYATDPLGRLWIGTKGDGITIGGVRYARDSRSHPSPTDDFYDIVFDRRGRAWLATWGAGLLHVSATADSHHIRFNSLLNSNNKESRIRDLLLDRKGRLWIATTNGIAMIDTRRAVIKDRDILRFNEANGCLPIDEITCAFQSSDGTLWFGTTRGVLHCTYNEKTKRLSYQQYNKSNGLVSDIVRSITEDRYGDIWIGTEEGLTKISVKDHDMHTFLPGSSIQENGFTENCALTLADGRLAFGVTNGLLLITPQHQPSQHKQTLKAVITDMTVNGISVYEDEKPFMQALSNMKEIKLPADKNSLSIFFSNFNYPFIHNTMYQYYLEGADHTWRAMTSINHADYTDLRPGHYTLHLRTMSPDSKWSDETLMRISISEPWYNTWLARIIYIIILTTVGYTFYRFWRRNFDLRQKIKMERQLIEFRIDFFTHISHEFRTPLNIIISAVEKLTDESRDLLPKRTVLTLNRSVRRMQRLINQLADFRKASTGNLRLCLNESDIVSFVRGIYNDMRSVALQKGANMTFTPWTTIFTMPFDREKVEAMVYNLLSNAIKYTPDQTGIIEIRMRQDGDNVVITVEDNGPGISAEQEEQLFQPFMHGYVSHGGMGIGLYNAHEMALLHHGSLSYHRSTALGGSIFTLTLPCYKIYYRGDEYAKVKAIENDNISDSESDSIIKEMMPKAINDITVVVIEDDPDMMEQIKRELSAYFHVVGFTNGNTGYEGVQKLMPSLLICDIMLPGMSGYEIISGLKSNPQTQNIPVIILTAFDDTNHKLRAYKSFADDYMVKPCDPKLLVARALQFVSMDAKSKGRIEEKENGPTPTEGAEPAILTSTLDKKFRDKVEAVVTQHLSEHDFNVDRLGALLSMGRTTLYSRMKTVMGISPNMYIQNERLRVAAEMLLQGKYTVAEISDKVGFSDPTYFYRCFKSKYGVAPSKYGR